MPKNRKALVEAFIDSVRDLHRAMWQRQDASLKHFNLQPAQVRVLFFVRHRQPVGAKDIAHVFGVTPSAATQLVDSLVRKGYLRRVPDPDDRRKLRLELSKKSRERFDRFRTEHFAIAKKVLAPLGDADLTTLIRIQRKIAVPASRR